MSEAVIHRKVALLAAPSLRAQSAIEVSLMPATRNRKGVPKETFRYEFDLFSFCSCTQAKRVKAEMTREIPYRKRYQGQLTAKKIATLRCMTASLI
jgi:hypothetical protein